MKPLKTNNMTAVEWLEQEIFRKYKFTLQQLNCKPLEEAIEQAKEMEKQQQGYSEEDMKQAYLDGCKIKLTNIYHLEKWFETFKKK